jgi:hypothetical protein
MKIVNSIDTGNRYLVPFRGDVGKYILESWNATRKARNKNRTGTRSTYNGKSFDEIVADGFEKAGLGRLLPCSLVPPRKASQAILYQLGGCLFATQASTRERWRTPLYELCKLERAGLAGKYRALCIITYAERDDATLSATQAHCARIEADWNDYGGDTPLRVITIMDVAAINKLVRHLKNAR